MDEDSGTCGICGVDPAAYEGVAVGLTEVNLCAECHTLLREMDKEGGDA